MSSAPDLPHDPSSKDEQQLQAILAHAATRIGDASNRLRGAVAAAPGQTGSFLDEMLNSTLKASPTLSDVQKQTAELQRYAGAAFVATGIMRVSAGVYESAVAFTDQPPRNREGAAHLLQVTGGLLTGFMTISRWAGPLAYTMGEFLSLISEYLLAGGTPQRTVAEELRNELRAYGGEETINRLGGVLDALERMQADLAAMKPASKTWDELLFVGSFEGGPEVIWLGDAARWLRNPENQKQDIWETVFEAYVLAVSEFAENFLFALKALIRQDAQQKPTEGFERASAVLRTVQRQYRDFIQDISPVVINKGTVWHLGTSGDLYVRKQVVGDLDWKSLGGRSSELAVGAGERIWTVGDGGKVWTGYDGAGSWRKPTLFSAHDLWVTPQTAIRGGKLDFYQLYQGQLHYHVWDEAKQEDVRTERGWEKWSVPSTRIIDTGGHRLKTLRTLDDGTVYALNDGGVFVLLQAFDATGKPTSTHHVPSAPSGAKSLKGIAVTDEMVVLYSDTKLWRKKHEAVLDPKIAWQEIVGPLTNNMFVMPETWSYDFVSGCTDGTLIAVIQEKMYSWHDEKWLKNQRGEAKRVFKAAAKGWGMFGKLQGLVDDLGKQGH